MRIGAAAGRAVCGGLLVCAACGGGAGGGATAKTRDSAGIAIVENSGPGRGLAWQVESAPFLDIGGVAPDRADKGDARGAPVSDSAAKADSAAAERAYEFDQVRGPVRLSDGRIVVANAGSSEVRIFDSSGAFLHSSGRSGTGPGEYQNIVGIWTGPGDSLLVSDLLMRRLTVLDRDGKPGRSFSLGGESGVMMPSGGRISLAIPTGWAADGSILAVAQAFALNSSREGSFRDSMEIVRYAADGAARDTLGKFPSVEMENMTLTIGTQSVRAPTAVPMGKTTATLVHGDRLYLAQNNAWEIEVRGADGSLRSLIRADVKATALTPEDIAASRKEQLQALDAVPQMKNAPEAIKKQVTARVEQAKYPATMPFFSELLADNQGNIWALEVTTPTRKVRRYAVIDSAGQLLGRVTMPEKFNPTHITGDAVFGVWRDADDVEHVRGYRLRKS